ncbi:MAG: hypothetical protein EBU11_03655 [Gammaproteobacteria bacterium]|nr:hypothetical protein [Gammaproteobacteria bacterium]
MSGGSRAPGAFWADGKARRTAVYRQGQISSVASLDKTRYPIGHTSAIGNDHEDLLPRAFSSLLSESAAARRVSAAEPGRTQG